MNALSITIIICIFAYIFLCALCYHFIEMCKDKYCTDSKLFNAVLACVVILGLFVAVGADYLHLLVNWSDFLLTYLMASS